MTGYAYYNNPLPRTISATNCGNSRGMEERDKETILPELHIQVNMEVLFGDHSQSN
jgi:hypothetical protein